MLDQYGVFKMYRCAVTVKNGEIKIKNCDSKDQCDEWRLKIMHKYELKKAIIVNKDNIKERWIENF